MPDPRAGPAAARQSSGLTQPLSDPAGKRRLVHLLPAGANDQFPPAEVQQLLIGMREFSQCVRSHGVPNWPDPSTDSEGRPVFDLGAAGITRTEYHSPQLQAKMAECQHLLPSALGGTPVGGP